MLLYDWLKPVLLLSLLLLAGCSHDERTVAEEGTTEENNAFIEVVYFENMGVFDMPGTWSVRSSAWSDIRWGVDSGKEFSESWKKSMNEKCGGLCGSVKIDADKSAEGYAGFSLDLSRQEKNGAWIYADVASWNQLCLAYESTLDFSVLLESVDSLGYVLDDSMPTGQYKRTGENATEVHCLKWKEFKQDMAKGVSGKEAAKRLKSIHFRFSGKSGTSGNFNMKRFGAVVESEPLPLDSSGGTTDSAGADDKVAVPIDTSQNLDSAASDTLETGSLGTDTLETDTTVVDTPTTPGNPSNETSVYAKELVVEDEDLIELWDGLKYYQVKTGFDGKGDWYVFDDSVDEGMSYVTWPAEVGGEYSKTALDYIIDECGGLCGDIDFVRPYGGKGYFGVAFDVAGKDSLTGKFVAVDVTAQWKGLCLTYESEMDGAVMLDPNEGVTQFSEVRFESSATQVRKCFGWDAFKKSSGDEDDEKNVAESLVTIRFKFEGVSGSRGYFKLARVNAVKELGQLAAD